MVFKILLCYNLTPKKDDINIKLRAVPDTVLCKHGQHQFVCNTQWVKTSSGIQWEHLILVCIPSFNQINIKVSAQACRQRSAEWHAAAPAMSSGSNWLLHLSFQLYLRRRILRSNTRKFGSTSLQLAMILLSISVANIWLSIKRERKGKCCSGWSDRNVALSKFCIVSLLLSHCSLSWQQK